MQHPWWASPFPSRWDPKMPFEKPILLLAALIMGQFPAVRRWIKDHWSRAPATCRKPCQKDACHPGAKTPHSVAASADLAAGLRAG